MKIIAMYPSIAAMKKGVGKPFRYILESGSRLKLADWASVDLGDAFQVVAAKGAPQFPEWKAMITIDEQGTLLSADRDIDWRAALNAFRFRERHDQGVAYAFQTINWTNPVTIQMDNNYEYETITWETQ